jgi:hypothetical protein
MAQTQVGRKATLIKNVVIGPQLCTRIAAITRGRNQRRQNQHFHRFASMDGIFADHNGSQTNYEPNSFNGPVEDPAYREHPRTISGSVDR